MSDIVQILRTAAEAAIAELQAQHQAAIAELQAKNLDLTKENERLKGGTSTDATQTDRLIHKCEEWGSGTMEGPYNEKTYCYEGMCTFSATNGYKLSGMRKTGKFVGQCELKYSDGTVLKGKYNDVNQYPNIKHVEANFVEQCTKTFANGDVLVGEHKNGDFIGQCTKTFANGDVLVGKRKNGAFVGQCTKTFANGNVLVGEREDFQFVGLCTQTFTNGNVLIGVTKNGNFVGRCFMIYGRHVEGRVDENNNFVAVKVGRERSERVRRGSEGERSSHRGV